MRGDFAIETPLKFFVVLVVAVLLINLARTLYRNISQGVEDLVPDEKHNEYEVMEIGTANAAQLASMADSCHSIGAKMKPLSKEFGCFIVRGSFSGVNTTQLQQLVRNPLNVSFSPSSNALFIIYDFPTKTVIMKS